ncbi:uncharacterized protein LOC114520167 [Dendronephthya gigantea]|uniref:uncharacterized protein LOC114520167 n=1 Tax=Dendronephthya gigantea TaxID=151771 RepID=UPI001069AD59|nr:uncharacterized protein LOC114520167 [Dendronephthya gigantea]
MYSLLKACLLFTTLQKAKLCECTSEAVFRKHVGKYLAGKVLRTEKAQSESECGMYCLRHRSCLSVNYKTAGVHKGKCELNNAVVKDLSKKKRYSDDVYLEKVWLDDKKEEQSAFAPSCKEMFVRDGSLPDGVYTLQKNQSSPPYKVYCHMTDIPGCGGGGWTLVMKLDGKKSTFIYGSPLWTNKETHAIQDGLEGLTEKESKLASYWNTPFTKTCLGMSHNGDRKWMTFDYTASSLYSVIADGQFRATPAGRTAWLSWIADFSVQPNCNVEGFNVRENIELRIGLVGNNENDCRTCDTWIGMGTTHNRMVCSANGWIRGGGRQTLKTFGYILVQ